MKETLLCPLEISAWERFLERSPNGSCGHTHRHQQEGGGVGGLSQRTVVLSTSLGFGEASWSGKGGGNMTSSTILSESSETGPEGNDTPLHYSCLENPMDGGAW